MTDKGGGGWEGMDLSGEDIEVSWEFDLRSKTVTVSSVATAAENKPVYSLPVHDVFAGMATQDSRRGGSL
jgi:hypothetical protein